MKRTLGRDSAALAGSRKSAGTQSRLVGVDPDQVATPGPVDLPDVETEIEIPLVGADPDVFDAQRRKLFHPAQVIPQSRTALVPTREDLAQEALVAGPVGEPACSTDEQCLLDSPLEAVMGLLDRSILVRPPRRVPIRFHSVVRHRPEIAFVEPAMPVLQIVRGRREVVGAMLLGHSPTCHRQDSSPSASASKLSEKHRWTASTLK